MSAPKRWRVKRLGESPADLFFPQGISEAEVRALYRDCFVEPAPSPDMPSSDSDGGGDDDES